MRAHRIGRRKALGLLAAAAAGTAGGTFAYGYFNVRHRLEVTRQAIAFPRLPAALDGLTIGFLSDTHRSATVPHALIDAAVRLLLAEKPDVIVLGGDYVTWRDRAFVHEAAEVLAPLTAPHGVFAVLGNHDDDRDMPAALAARHFTVLRDQRTRLAIRGEPLDLAGIRYWTRKVEDIAPLLRGAADATILIAHTPSRLTEAAALGVPLLLSGHTHGGQIVLPVLGAVAARRYAVISGVGRLKDTTAFVTRGVGTVYLPVRLNCAPEVAVLTLATA